MDIDENDSGIRNMAIILKELGFSSEETERYMRLYISGKSSAAERLKMLGEKRSSTLNEIHLKEQQLMRMDYMKNEIRSEK